MIKVYILNCDVEEIEGKLYNEITDEEFKLFGIEYTIEQFQERFNNVIIPSFNLSTDYIRFIDDSNDKFMDSFSKSIDSGLTIHFVENPAAPEGKAYLHINPKNMPRNE